MEKLLIFGAGLIWNDQQLKIKEMYDVLALVDNDSTKQGKTNGGLNIISPSNIQNYDYSRILILAEPKNEIMTQLLSMNISKEKFLLYPEFETNIKNVKIFDDCSVEVQINDLKFQLKSRSDFVIFNEIFLKNDYKMFYPNSDITIIDIGMNIGLTTLYYAELDNVKEIHSFEPFTPTYNMAVENIEMNKSKFKQKIKTYNYGLGKQQETKQIRYNENFPGGMSIYNDGSIDGVVETIQIKNASEILRKITKNKKGKKVILKMDCEGAEYEILEDLDKTGLINQLDAIILEFHGERNDILEHYFEKNNFYYQTSYANYRYNLGYINAVKVGV